MAEGALPVNTFDIVCWCWETRNLLPEQDYQYIKLESVYSCSSHSLKGKDMDIFGHLGTCPWPFIQTMSLLKYVVAVVRSTFIW